MKHLTHSPLALPFEKALQPSAFLLQMTTAAENQVRDQIIEYGNHVLGTAVAGAKFVLESGTVQVVFEGGIPAGAKLMKATGNALPVLVDGKTGKIIKIGRVASKGRVVASIAANAALIAVEAAHMISGYDNAKRLKAIERSVDRLVHAHESELKARLESIYRYGKELLYEGTAGLTELDQRELHRQCRDLMELRARWRDDFRYQLRRIDRAEPGLLDRILHGRAKSQQASRKKKAEESMAALELVQLMHFSLVLQMALAGGAGRMESFTKLTLEDESQSWKSLVEFGRQRVAEIASGTGTEEFQQFFAALDEMAEFWSPSRWGQLEQKEIVGPQSKEGMTGSELTTGVHSDFPVPPEEGWTVFRYAEVRGMPDYAAWHELRALCAEGKLTECRRDGFIHYVRRV